MPGRLLSAFVVIAALCLPRTLFAQFTDARTYTQSPVGLNQLELDYSHAHSNASIDTPFVIAGANFELNQVTASYTHDFGVLGHLAWVELAVPFARLSGAIAGTNISGSTTGTGDISLEFAGLLKGGRAFSAAELESYQATTVVGLSLTITAPTGQYDADKLLNLGSNRWSFKPEIAVSYPFGRDEKWELDGYLNVYFFTDNTAYKGVEILRQEALPGIEVHLSYSFTSSLWASLDTRYCARGVTWVDDANQDDAQESFTLGSELYWSPDSHSSLGLVFAKAVLHTNAPAYTGVTLKYVYSWVHDSK